MSIGTRNASARAPQRTFLRATEVLGMTCAPPPSTQVMEVDRNQTFSLPEVESSPRITIVWDKIHHREIRLFDAARSTRCTSMNSELSPSDVGIGQMNKKNWVSPVKFSALPLIAKVNGKNFVAEESGESDVEMGSPGSNLSEQVQIATKFVRMVRNVLFKRAAGYCAVVL